MVPAVVGADEALAELVHHRAQHGAGIVSKVQISDLHHRNRDDGERLLVLFGGTRSQLQGSHTQDSLCTAFFLNFNYIFERKKT